MKKGRRKCQTCGHFTAWNDFNTCVTCRLKAAADNILTAELAKERTTMSHNGAAYCEACDGTGNQRFTSPNLEPPYDKMLWTAQCPHCNGRGWLKPVVTEKCPICGERDGSEIFKPHEPLASQGYNGAWYGVWCKQCVLVRQIEYAREAAIKIPLLQQELLAVLHAEGFYERHRL